MTHAEADVRFALKTLEVIQEVLDQEQPGMPVLPELWNTVIRRQTVLAIDHLNQALTDLRDKR